MARPQGRDPAKEQRWRRLLGLWRRSGLTGRDFCAEHGLSEPSFYAWRREIARRDQEAVSRSRAKRPLVFAGADHRSSPVNGRQVSLPVQMSARGPPVVKPQLWADQKIFKSSCHTWHFCEK
jgi:hypothetical protein